MKVNVIFSLFLCLACAMQGFSQPNVSPKKLIDGKEFYVYRVESGEGFYSVGRKFHVTQEEILQYNPEARYGLRGGQELIIPAIDPESTETTSPLWFTHTIAPGETLYSIAHMYQVTPESIIALNPGAEKGIKSGFSIKIPQTTLRSTVEKDRKAYVYHTIAPKETLYSLARQYHTDIESIVRENPGLTPETFAAGKVIRIPPVNETDEETPAPVSAEKEEASFLRHEVQKKETLYSISKHFGVSIPDLIAANPGLKRLSAGMILNIPVAEKVSALPAKGRPAVKEEDPGTMQDLFVFREETTGKKEVNVALLLPFMLNHPQNKTAPLYLEYYEGFLLAVEEMQKKGLSVNVYVYDTQSSAKQVKRILSEPELENMDLIIGPVEDNLIKTVADFALAHDINLVNIFSLKNEEALHNARIFQTNIPHPYLYAEAIREFSRLFADRRVIFITDPAGKNDKKEFVSALKTDLDRRSVPYSGFTADLLEANVENLLQQDSAQAIVFVPEGGNFESLSHLLPTLRTIRDKHPLLTFSLFGYPEWQTYTKDFIENFYALDTYIFTRFYVDPTDPHTREFYKRYKYWYSKDVQAANPQYGILGYDTGMFFLKALQKYGKDFGNRIDGVNHSSIQTDFYFQRVNNWTGFINKGSYFVHFTPFYKIEKIEIR